VGLGVGSASGSVLGSGSAVGGGSTTTSGPCSRGDGVGATRGDDAGGADLVGAALEVPMEGVAVEGSGARVGVVTLG
jgi:hypothetical protein